MNYEMGIGSILDENLGLKVPIRRIIMSEQQRDIIVLMANKTIGELGHPIYSINGCQFTIYPDFGSDKPFYKQQEEI